MVIQGSPQVIHQSSCSLHIYVAPSTYFTSHLGSECRTSASAAFKGSSDEITAIAMQSAHRLCMRVLTLFLPLWATRNNGWARISSLKVQAYTIAPFLEPRENLGMSRIATASYTTTKTWDSCKIITTLSISFCICNRYPSGTYFRAITVKH